VTHPSDEQLVLHYYGEDGVDLVTTERHLRECAQCADAYGALVRTLDAVTPPEFVETTPVDDLWALRQMLRDRVGSRARKVSPRLVALVWLVPLLYPLSFPLLFGSGRLAQAQILAAPLVVLAVAWTCAGPFVAAFALNRTTVDFEWLSSRLFAGGAMVAAATPGLYLFIARVLPGLAGWYAALTLAVLGSLAPWPSTPRSTKNVLVVHRLSAAVIAIFALTHVANQLVGFVNESSYAAALTFLREGYHQPIVEWLLLTSSVVQIFTGATMGMKKVRPGAWTDNFQAISGWYLAMFLITHALAPRVLNHGVAPAPASVIAATQFNLLATTRGAASLPFLLLGVVAFLYHIGTYARLAALAYLAEVQVRRLSYAAVFVGTSVVVTLGLALCGVHVIR
jgi:succinate dehydrogenase/fumarate reductase cytochrome b subunit